MRVKLVEEDNDNNSPFAERICFQPNSDLLGIGLKGQGYIKLLSFLNLKVSLSRLDFDICNLFQELIINLVHVMDQF